MLKVNLKTHRKRLLADTSGQKLFVLLSIEVAKEVEERGKLFVSFVLDTSGSMNETVNDKSKIEIVVESLKKILESNILKDDDEISIITFDDEAKIVLPFTAATKSEKIFSSFEQIKTGTVGTNLGAGMKVSLDLLKDKAGIKKMVVLTDGNVFDPDQVEKVLDELVFSNISVISVGVGDEWNEDLLCRISDRTLGKPLHLSDVENDSESSSNINVSKLPYVFLNELGHATQEVVMNIEMEIELKDGFSLERITKIFPVQYEIMIENAPYLLGNLESRRRNVYLLEFNIPSMPVSKVEMGKIELYYQVPNADTREKIGPFEIGIEFTKDQLLAVQTDQEVMDWVQQRNIEKIVSEAISQAHKSPEEAEKILGLARSLTIKLKNEDLTALLDKAIEEIRVKKYIGSNVAKTLKIGTKTQLLDHSREDMPTDDDIRKATGR
ncbi:Ca-activated chloride channel family protein [Thermodesulfobium acidiphilum]|uniref:Ca-activated chloride channel family protein n=1 Tax=Thermodesulfobium acidiphilum TaxID=1794699 RepID=A0A2R4VZL0_THEAF|nr:VWA domain-containing protein [Thermodesulfobium acidiphilum]AWB09904.1 Ca-activated chloride channel family protein [Thermodesulfobium acidiphilum]